MLQCVPYSNSISQGFCGCLSNGRSLQSTQSNSVLWRYVAHSYLFIDQSRCASINLIGAPHTVAKLWRRHNQYCTMQNASSHYLSSHTLGTVCVCVHVCVRIAGWKGALEDRQVGESEGR